MVAYNTEGLDSIRKGMWLMSTNGPTNRASEDATSAGVTTGAVSKMRIGLRKTLQASGNEDWQLLYYCCNRLLHKVGWSKGTPGQYRGLNGQVPIRVHLVPIWMPNRTNQWSRRTLPRPSGVELNDILCTGTQDEYTILCVGQLIGQIRQQYIAKHPPENSQWKLDRRGHEAAECVVGLPNHV